MQNRVAYQRSLKIKHLVRVTASLIRAAGVLVRTIVIGR